MPTLTTPTPLENAVLLPRESIRPNPSQPRDYFAPQQMEELADSIRTFGIRQPIQVRYEPSRYDGTPYILIAGERRFRASEGILDNIPCIIADVDAETADELSLLENLQRRDLTAAEEAKRVARLMTNKGLNAREVAERLHKSPTWVNNRLSYLKTKPDVQEVGERMPKVLSSLLLVNTVAAPEKRSELLADIEYNYAPHAEIKSKVETIKSTESAQAAAAEFAARSQTAPDSETASRSNAAARGESSGMSRGQRVTGAPRNEANAHVKRALGQLEAWVKLCDGPTHAEAVKLARRILREDLSR